MSDPMLEKGELINGLARSLHAGAADLQTIPKLVKKVVRTDAWRERTVPQTREVVTFGSFAEFVGAKPLHGLGAEVRTIQHLCRDDTEALDLIDQALQRPSHVHAGDVDNVNVKPDGNSTQAALRRLRKDREDLHAKVLAGEISAHAAMVEAGFRPQTATVRLDDMERAATALRRRLTDEQRQELAELLRG